ncbi:MAG TPA: hypothetical protein VKB81_11770, partial [Nitrospira sp.]|nr:hypothetical protein [Nitrospira sp.]
GLLSHNKRNADLRAPHDSSERREVRQCLIKSDESPYLLTPSPTTPPHAIPGSRIHRFGIGPRDVCGRWRQRAPAQLASSSESGHGVADHLDSGRDRVR